MIAVLLSLYATFGVRATEARRETFRRSLERVTGWPIATESDDNHPFGAFTYASPRYIPPFDPRPAARDFSLHHEAVHGACWTRAVRENTIETAALAAAVSGPETDPAWSALPESHRFQFINNEVLACYRSSRLAGPLERRGLKSPFLGSMTYLKTARALARASRETWALVIDDQDFPFEYVAYEYPENPSLAWVRVRVPRERDVRGEFVLLAPARFAECADLLRPRLRDVGRAWIAYLTSQRWLGYEGQGASTPPVM